VSLLEKILDEQDRAKSISRNVEAKIKGVFPKKYALNTKIGWR